MFVALDAENDALTVTHLHGVPLEFDNAEDCYAHVGENIDGLKALANEHYRDTAIKQIDCFRKPTEI